MALYVRREGPVEARQYEGESQLIVMSDAKGQQTAKKGDWLVGSERGKITVLSALKFQEKYKPFVPETPAKARKSS